MGNFSDPMKDSEQVFGTVKDTIEMPLWQKDLFDNATLACFILFFMRTTKEINGVIQW